MHSFDHYNKTCDGLIMNVGNSDKMRPIIIRYGEIGLKSAFVRRNFENQLKSNVEDAFLRAKLESSVVREHGRLFAYVEDVKRATEALKRVFGIVSFSPSVECSSDEVALKETGVRVLEGAFKGGESFAVRARRSGTHKYTSQQAAAFIGGAVLDAYAGKKLRVDLQDPDVALYVEIRENRAYFYRETIAGPLGMPLGSQGKVIGLLSPEPSSNLAHWLIMKRGCNLDLLFLDKGLPNEKERSYANAEKLREWNPNMRIHELQSPSPGEANFTKEDYAASSEFAFKKGALALVSGETLEALLQKGRFEDNVASMPIFFPLVGFSDDEIANRMRDAFLS